MRHYVLNNNRPPTNPVPIIAFVKLKEIGTSIAKLMPPTIEIEFKPTACHI